MGCLGAIVQGEHLVEGFLVGDKADFDEFLPGATQDVPLHAQPLTEGLISVIAQALGIGHGYQKQVKGCGLVTAAVDIAVTDQAMIKPTELFGDFAQPLGTYQTFFHKGLLCLVG